MGCVWGGGCVRSECGQNRSYVTATPHNDSATRRPSVMLKAVFVSDVLRLCGHVRGARVLACLVSRNN